MERSTFDQPRTADDLVSTESWDDSAVLCEFEPQRKPKKHSFFPSTRATRASQPRKLGFQKPSSLCGSSIDEEGYRASSLSTVDLQYDIEQMRSYDATKEILFVGGPSLLLKGMLARGDNSLAGPNEELPARSSRDASPDICQKQLPVCTEGHVSSAHVTPSIPSLPRTGRPNSVRRSQLRARRSL